MRLPLPHRDARPYDKELHAVLEKMMIRLPGLGGSGAGNAPFYKITDAERLALVTPVNYGFPELWGERYGVSVDSADNSTAITNLLAVLAARGGGTGYLPAGILDYATGIVFDSECCHLEGAGGDRGITSSKGTVLNYTGTGGTAVKGDGVDGCGLHKLQVRNSGTGSIGFHLFNGANWMCSEFHVREFDADNWFLECDTSKSTIYNTFYDVTGFTSGATANGVRMLEGAGKAVNNNTWINSNFGSNDYGIKQDGECHDNAFIICELGGCNTGAQIRGRIRIDGNVENCNVGLELVSGSAYGVSGDIHYASNGTDVDNVDGRPLAAFMQGGGAGNSWGFSPTNTGLGMRGRVPPATGGINFSTSDGSPVLQRGDVDHLALESGLMRAKVAMLIDAAAAGGSINSKAAFQIDSVLKGFLPPRMTTTQRDAITSPPEGLEIYNLTTHKKNFYNGSAWEVVTSA